MPFSHHSHSGQYVAHAKDTLDEVVTRALALNMRTFCMTEHCPRYHSDLIYPEEEGQTVQDLINTFSQYVPHAKRLQAEVNSDKSNRTMLLVGFESEGGIDDEQLKNCQELREKYDMDIVVGSVHYLGHIPLDFDRESWLEAKKAHGTYRQFYKDYFDAQYEMLEALTPEVVAHFDLIRLLESPEDKDEATGTCVSELNWEKEWPDVWEAVGRNIDLINKQGNLIEFNSAAIRKGWDCPYPKSDITRLAMQKGAKFCMSDDSHGIAQVALNYPVVLKYMKSFGKELFPKVYFWDLDSKGKKFLNSMTIEQLADDPFWKQDNLPVTV